MRESCEISPPRILYHIKSYLLRVLQWRCGVLRGMQQQWHERYHRAGLTLQHQQRRGGSCDPRHIRQSATIPAQAGAVNAARYQAPVALDPAVGGDRLLHHRVQEAEGRTRGRRPSALRRRRSNLQGGRQGEREDRGRPASPRVPGQDHGVL